MDEDGLPIVGSGVDLTKVSMHITVANQANSWRKQAVRSESAMGPAAPALVFMR